MLEKNSRSNKRALLLTVLILTGLCQIGSAVSSVSLSQQTVTASVGDTFNVDIIVDPAGSEVFGTECKLHFDNTVLKATSQTPGTFLNQGNVETIELLNDLNNTIGMTNYAQTRIGEPDVVGSATEKGVLETITFEVINSGTSDMKLESKLSDSNAQLIDVENIGGTCSVSGASKNKDTLNTDKPATQQTSEESYDNQLPGFGIGCLAFGLCSATFMMLRKKNV